MSLVSVRWSDMRTVAVTRALNDEDLLLGAEKPLVLVSLVISAAMIVAIQNAIAAVLGIALWFLSLMAFRAMARSDPRLSAVYRRLIRYQPYYPAKAHAGANTARFKR